jgi:hypothetical protein
VVSGLRQQVDQVTLTLQQFIGVEFKLSMPLKVYTSIAGVTVPGVRVPQLVQMVFSVRHSCIISTPLSPEIGTTFIVTVPKLTPLHVGSAPVMVTPDKLQPAISGHIHIGIP